LIDERYGYGSGTRRRKTRPDQAALFHTEAILRLIEIAAIAKPKRQTKPGEKWTSRLLTICKTNPI
jgi:hypothetical protein